MTICTGNPEQLWTYDYPDTDGNHQVTMSEKQILDFMKLVHEDAYQRAEVRYDKIISDEDKIDDWISVNWAYKVDR